MQTYEQAGTWPGDGVDVDEATFGEFSGDAPEGKTRAAGGGGLPCWVDIPRRYNEWRRYRVLLSRVETSIAPDIEWPSIPSLSKQG